jgi:hypothetical protein
MRSASKGQYAARDFGLLGVAEQVAIMDAACTNCGEAQGAHVLSDGRTCCADGKRFKRAVAA